MYALDIFRAGKELSGGFQGAPPAPRGDWGRKGVPHTPPLPLTPAGAPGQGQLQAGQEA